MSTELTRQLKCVVLNGGVEMWVDEDQAAKVEDAIQGGIKFIKIHGELINTFNVVGVFNAATMSDKIRRRNGDWQCNHGNWWKKADSKCGCETITSFEEQKRMADEVRKQYGITD